MDDVSWEANQSSTNTQSSHHPNAEGIRSSLHGTIYQLKLSILFLQNALKKGYKFELYSEKNDANKFDDVIFKYDKNNKYRFLQAKHKLEPAKDRITMEKLCSDDNKEPFSLQQYFIAFRKISQNNNYKGKIEDFIICTNTDFTDAIKNDRNISKQDNVDDILNIEGGICYKFVFDENSKIQKKLQGASDVKRLAKELYKIINGKDKSINLKQELFKAYHIPLMKEVLKRLDKEEGRCIFQDNFISGTGISDNAQLLREALEQESINASDLLKQKKNTKLELRKALDHKEQKTCIISDFWKKAKNKKFEVSSSFGKHPKLTAEKLARANNDEIKELDELLAEFHNNSTPTDRFKELFYKYYDALVKEGIFDTNGFKISDNSEIARKFSKLNETIKTMCQITQNNELTQHINRYDQTQNNLAKKIAQDFAALITNKASSNILDLKLNKSPFSKYQDKKSYIKEKLPGYILVKAEEENCVRFNLNFPEENLPQDLRTFKIELWNFLSIIDSSQLQDIRLKVSSDITDLFPEEEELYSEVFLPSDVVKDDEIRDFFEKLVLAVNQPNEEDLRDLIEEKIFNDLDYLTNKEHAEFIYNFVQSQMLDWLKSPKSIALTEKDDFFERGRKKVYAITSCLSRIEYTRHFKKFNIEFTDRGLEEIKKFLNLEEQKKILVIKTTSKNLLLTQAKVHQVKPEIPWPLEVLLVAKTSGTSLRNLSQDALVIVCENETSLEESELRHYLTGLNRKLILITCNDNISWFDYGSKQYKQIEDKTTLKDLSKNFVLKKLLRKDVTFQGQRTCFASVLDIDDAILEGELPDHLLQKLEKVMDAKVITEIIFNQDISVGDILPSFQDKNSRYYDPFHIDIRRGLNAQIIEENRLLELLSNIKTGIFAFSHITDGVKNFISRKNKDDLRTFKNVQQCDELFFDGKYYILSHENPMNDFRELCKHHTDNVSWFEFSDCNYKLKYSDVLPKLKNYTKLTLIGNITDINDPVLILAGDPGIGKSTVLTTYTQELGSSSWVIRINLKEHDEYLKDCYVDNEDNLIKFLLKNIDVGRNNPITNSLLKYRINHQGRIILFLDGYDEISDESQNNVIDLITFMTTTKGRVWITTRTNEQRNMENALGTFSYILRRFNEKEQTLFLKGFWARVLKTKSSLIEDYVNVFAEHFREGFQSMGYDHLLGIALQTRMIAEIFMEGCQNYINSGEFNVDNLGIKNVYDLYTQFIFLQYKIYLEKKGIYKYLSKGEQYSFYKLYTKGYGHAAMKTLFHDNEICKKLLELKKVELDYEDLNKIGIIKRVEENEFFDFIHQTYMEYFVAKYLIYALSKNENGKMFKLVNEFLLKNIFFERHRLIRVLMESEIQTLDKEDLKRKWNSINEKDLFRKTKVRSCNGLPFFVLRYYNEILDHNTENSYDHYDINELLKIVDKCMRWRDNGYYFNGDTELINELFKKYFRETNIDSLHETLIFLADKYGRLHYRLANNEFTRNDNIHRAFRYYLSELVSQKKYDVDRIKKILDRYLHDFDESVKTNILNLMDMMKIPCDDDQKPNILSSLDEVLFSTNFKIMQLPFLNNILDIIFDSYESIIEDIIAEEDIHDGFKKQILNFLENVSYEERKDHYNVLSKANLGQLERFCTEILFPSNSSPKIFNTSKIYFKHKKSYEWLERNGLLIIRILKILTLDVAKVFIDKLDNLKGGFRTNFSINIFSNIRYFLTMMFGTDFPNMDKLAFLKLITKFSPQIMNQDDAVLSFDQQTTALKLVEKLLNENDENEEVYSSVIEYFRTLAEVGLSIIDVGEQLLVIDKITEFQLELTINCKKQLLQHITLKRKNDETVTTEVKRLKWH